MTTIPTQAALLLAVVLLAGCSDSDPTPQQQPISYRTRAENAPIKVLKEHRLSDTETVRLISVPGFPFGERCVLYTGPQTSSLQCGEDSRTNHD
jgi:hypothetical protein